MMPIKPLDISSFKKVNHVLDGSEWLLVIKSQDQVERRRRMLESRKGGKIGRIKERPIAVGLLSKIRLTHGQCEVLQKREFREPRHVKRHPDGGYLITEINCVKWITESGDVKQEYNHPFFAFLHTIDISPDGQRMLVVSSGYDACFEFEIKTGDITMEWFAWDHGFNPDEDGVWLTVSTEKREDYLADGKKTELIDPKEYGEQGLVTARRTAHPNVAVYDVYSDRKEIIISIAHDGAIYRVDQMSGTAACISHDLQQMSHGIYPHLGGWAITNTTRAEWWFFSADWVPMRIVSCSKMPGKVKEAANVEWVQQVIPVGTEQCLFLDSNRGLIAVDFSCKTYSVYQPHSDWCVQDALLLK